MPKTFNVKLDVQQDQAVSTKGEARQAGRGGRGWFHRFLVGTVPQRGRPGAFAVVQQFMKRCGFGNWYSEKVTDQKSGNVLHECHEPLDRHQQHGSAKPQLPKSDP